MKGVLNHPFIGEMITIIADGNKVYINSICDPDKRPNVVSMGMNRKHKKELMYNIKNPEYIKK